MLAMSLNEASVKMRYHQMSEVREMAETDGPDLLETRGPNLLETDGPNVLEIDLKIRWKGCKHYLEKRPRGSRIVIGSANGNAAPSTVRSAKEICLLRQR